MNFNNVEVQASLKLGRLIKYSKVIEMYVKTTKKQINVGTKDEDRMKKLLKQFKITYSTKVEGVALVFFNNLKFENKPLSKTDANALVKILEREGL